MQYIIFPYSSQVWIFQETCMHQNLTIDTETLREHNELIVSPCVSTVGVKFVLSFILSSFYFLATFQLPYLPLPVLDYAVPMVWTGMCVSPDLFHN